VPTILLDGVTGGHAALCPPCATLEVFAAGGAIARATDRRALLQKYIYWLRTVFDLSGSKRLMPFAD
jgi:hypothetical protein